MSQCHAHQADACAQGTTVSGTLSARWDAGGGAREDTVEASAGVHTGRPAIEPRNGMLRRADAALRLWH